MNLVVQEDATGCGIASAAMLADITYKQAKEAAARLGIQVTDSHLWSDDAFLRTLLKHYGIGQALTNSLFVPGILSRPLPSSPLNGTTKETGLPGMG